MNEEEMTEIIESYTDTLINTKHIVGKKSELPYDKSRIAEVLLQAYRDSEDEEEKGILEEAFLRLESFLSDDDFNVVSEYLNQIGELRESGESQEKVFEMAAEKIPSTALEVLDIFNKIEENLKQRRDQLDNS